MDKPTGKRVKWTRRERERARKREPPLFPTGPRECRSGAPDGCLCGVCCPSLAMEVYAAELVARDNEELEALHVSTALDGFFQDELPKRQKLRKEAEAIFAGLEIMGFLVFVDRGILRVEPADNLTPQIREMILTQPLREYLESIADERNDQKRQSAHGGQNHDLPALPQG
jgi:hypothetical protein